MGGRSTPVFFAEGQSVPAFFAEEGCGGVNNAFSLRKLRGWCGNGHSFARGRADGNCNQHPVSGSRRVGGNLPAW